MGRFPKKPRLHSLIRYQAPLSRPRREYSSLCNGCHVDTDSSFADSRFSVHVFPDCSDCDGRTDRHHGTIRTRTDRTAMLEELIPGSEDYFFYHCLHYQTTGELEKSESILKDWLAEHKGRETAAITAMLDRQRLLTYNDSPQRTIDYLVRRLGVKLNHPPPAVKGERRYPSTLDVAELDIDRIVKDACGETIS